jgi:outer membrane lipoprotein-sorting protein
VRVLSTLLLLLLFHRCAPFLPLSSGPMDATPEQIVEAIAKNVEHLHDLEAKVNVQIDASQIRETAVTKVLFREPDWLRIEVKGPLGVTVANVQMQGDTVRVYYPLSKVLLQGKPTVEHFELMTGIQIDVSDFRSLLSGQGGVARNALDSLVDFQIEGREYVCTYRYGGQLQRHWVDAKKLLITRSEFYDDDGSLGVRYLYRQYEEFNAVQLPTKIYIEKIKEHHRVQMTLKEGKVNRGIAEDRFQLDVPSDVERIELTH